MKKIYQFSILIIFSMIPLLTFAWDTPKADFGKYGLQKCNTLSEYQKYVGQTVMYIPKETPTDEDKWMFTGEFDKKYIITKITGNDSRIKLYLTEKGGKGKVKMRIYNRYKAGSFYISEGSTVPLLLMDKFENDKFKLIGKTFLNDRVITEYKCVDIIIKSKESIFPNSNYLVPYYVLKNSLTGEEKAYPAESAATDCFTEDISGKYISNLIKVEKPEDESIRYGETTVVEIEDVTKYRYIDNFIDILIFGSDKQFSFLLNNISQNTLKLIWNEAVFVDFSGTASKVMHIGTKYSQKNEEQSASTVIKAAHIEDIAVPTSNVRYSNILKEWITESMYPSIPATSPGVLRLMLPLQVKGVINEYIFVFRVDWESLLSDKK